MLFSIVVCTRPWAQSLRGSQYSHPSRLLSPLGPAADRGQLSVNLICRRATGAVIRLSASHKFTLDRRRKAGPYAVDPRAWERPKTRLWGIKSNHRPSTAGRQVWDSSMQYRRGHVSPASLAPFFSRSHGSGIGRESVPSCAEVHLPEDAYAVLPRRWRHAPLLATNPRPLDVGRAVPRRSYDAVRENGRCRPGLSLDATHLRSPRFSSNHLISDLRRLPRQCQ
ncbi:hypothetical protein C8Q77DRAFT_766715 [Trametes polyzona]|nr:hypothetical protein C8Q77DRAFT_766715 [Trametes polyzona]